MSRTNSTYQASPQNFFPFSYGETIGESAPDDFLYVKENHLGNVLTVVSDRKLPVDNNSDNIVDFYLPDVTSATDYYSFGAQMPGRSFNSPAYRYGHNGKEKIDEWNGNSGTIYDYGRRMYDARLGRPFSHDPLFRSYPQLSPYQFFSNNPILNIDWDGLEGRVNTFNFPSSQPNPGQGGNAAVMANDLVVADLAANLEGRAHSIDRKKIISTPRGIIFGGSRYFWSKDYTNNNDYGGPSDQGHYLVQTLSPAEESAAKFQQQQTGNQTLQGFVKMPGMVFGRTTGEIYKDKTSVDFNPLLDKGNQIVNRTIQILNNFQDQTNTTVFITIGGGMDVGVDVKKARGEAIQKRIIDSGFQGKVEIRTVNDEKFQFKINSVEGENTDDYEPSTITTPDGG